MRHAFLFFLLGLLLQSCTHPPLNTQLDQSWRPLPKGRYIKMLRSLTKKHREYLGINQIFDLRATFLTTAVHSEQLKYKAHFKNWGPEKALSEKTDLNQKVTAKSSMFLSFFSPNRKSNKLDKEFSDWSIFIIVGNTEIPGEIRLFENQSDHVKVFYPESPPWSKTYLAEFPIDTNQIQSKDFRVKLMGPSGMAELKYSPLNKGLSTKRIN